MKSILLAFSLFSRVPVPGVMFTKENMRYLMPAFPLVGVAAGLAAAVWACACEWLGFGPLLRGAGFALLPLWVSGGIHMDGLCDTADALASHGDAGTKQRILKDPHAGAFAVLAAAAYLIAFAALAAEGFSSRSALACFTLSFVLSRALSGLAVVWFGGSDGSMLVKDFHEAAARKICTTILLSWLAALCAALLWLGGVAGAAAFALPCALFVFWRHRIVPQFGGMSGDLAGCLSQLCELISLAALVVVPRILEKI